MIKLGIEGAETPLAGEIIRILVNHPDVELTALSAPALAGHRMAERHFGLIGECDAAFSQSIDPSGVDALIICSRLPGAESLSGLLKKYPQLKIIDASRDAEAEREGFVYGLSEIYRKPLVRGARCSYVPYPEEVAALIALYPLAAKLLLSGDIHLSIEAAPTVVDEGRLSESALSVARHLREAQLSFNGEIKFSFIPKPGSRALRLQADLPLSIGIDAAHEAYEDIYDDHNFTFHPQRTADAREVAGTHKCVVGVTAPGNGVLSVSAILDPLMRGGASEAVHLLNLLFGLHERTGLTLKASTPYL